MTPMNRPARPAAWRVALLALSLAAAGLSAGCAPLLLAGGAVGGALVVTDRRSAATQAEDQVIDIKVQNRAKELTGDKAHVNATAFNRLVLLTGEVPTEADRAAVAEAAAKVDNVRNVVNELAVMPPTSFSQRSNDTLVSTKVKATLVDAKDLQANAFKVVVERGVVYMMGRVTEREAARAADLIRTVPGVVRVVRVFEMMTEEELANLK
jgi:osmotically-inducible protein OsmY